MPPPSSSQAKEGLRKKLVWITVFRTAAACLLMGALAVRVLPHATQGLSTVHLLAFSVEGGVFLLTLWYGLWLRFGRWLRLLAWVQVTADVTVASALVLLTGGAESPFSFLFLLAVIAGAILLSSPGAMFGAGLSATAFCLAVMSLELLPSSWELTPQTPLSRLLFTVAIHLVSQVLVAVLTTYLAHQLSATGGRLWEREDDLRKLAELQRQILASMSSGLITSTAEGRVTFINRAGRAILGIPESLGRPLWLKELLPGAEAIQPGSLRAELLVEAAAGPQTLGIRVTELSGTPDSLLVVFQDLTELRRAEAALRRADELASLGTLSAQLAHEIRNPLASMRGSAQMLGEDLPKDATSMRLVQILVRESDRLESLVEGFLRFARPSELAREWVQLDQLVEQTVELVRADPLSSGVKLSVMRAPTDAPASCELWADPHQLRQVLLNLIRNALQAVGVGGSVKVSVENGPTTSVVRIWDSAGKIPPEELTKIFEPFYTTRRGGTGLGLSTAQAIVSAHGGRIEVSSSPHQGTEFAIQLPRELAEVKSA